MTKSLELPGFVSRFKLKLVVTACGLACLAGTLASTLIRAEELRRAGVPILEVASVFHAHRQQQAADSSGGVALVREYVARDGRGEHMRSSRWFIEATDSAAWDGADSFQAIATYVVKPLTVTPDSSRVRVIYFTVGNIVQRTDLNRTVGFRFVPKASTDTVDFQAVRTPRGWKIATPQFDPQVLVAELLKMPQMNFSKEDRARLKATLPSP